ncbi:MAG: gliding motility-associated C-terminal domain-containing protein [Chitinophagaceae bacterium]|nr:gliding motility-associated C-terminal domain-containing protein [Chitinophagaceae bacterium]
MSLPFRGHRIVLFSFLLINCPRVFAQKEFSQWLFGTYNGIDFRSGSPVAITNPSFWMFDYQGVATVCNWNGDLLFYSDGNIVYDRQHHQMPNGNGLFGNLYASQAVITVRAMHDTTLYYLFTVDHGGGTNPMAYSIVDMKANGGLGDVTAKNITLLSNPTEKLCAVKHCNGRDVWVIAHEWQSDAYYAYLVTPDGVSTTPVISHSGRLAEPDGWGYGNKIGCMKASPDGKKIATAFQHSGTDLSDFDNSTGIVSNSIAIPTVDNFWSLTFGVEFSPNSRLLYTTYQLNSTNTSRVYQFDVLAGSPGAISASRTKVAEQNFFGYVSTLQTGPDKKIYVANYGTKRVSIIHQPDVPGMACNYEWEGLQLIGDRSSHGFPSFIETKFDPEPIINTSVVCPLQKISFEYANKPDYILSVKWIFDDPASGIADTAYDINPVHEFTSEGTYHIRLIRFFKCTTDTIEKDINVKKLMVDLGNDTSVCSNTEYLLEPLVSANVDYLWQDGSTDKTLTANSSGLYWLQVSDPVTGCNARDSLTLDILAQPDFTLGPDQATCEKEIQFDISTAATSYLWNTGSNNNSISISNSGLYWLQVNNGKCFHRDSVELTFNALSVNIGADTTICENETLMLDAGNQLLDYTWQDGSKNNSFAVNARGLYIVTVSNGTCTAKDSVQVNYIKKPVFNLGEDKMFCNGDIITLGNQLDNIYSYLWEDGSTSAKRTVNKPGTFRLTASNECGSFTDEVVVLPGGCKLAIPNAFTPDGDGKNDVFKISKTYGLSSFYMQVFNRWGHKIFESRDQSQGWNGTLAGKNCDVGSYAYIISYRIDDGTPVTLKGTVTLIR